MKIDAITWINLLGFVLLLALGILLVHELAPELIVSIDWYDLASVGWVTMPG